MVGAAEFEVNLLMYLPFGPSFTVCFVTEISFMVCFGVHCNSTLGQGLITSTYPGEVLFSIALAISGLILFALLIGNMQVRIHF